MIEAKPPQDEVESGTYREVDDPVGGDPIGGDPVGGDPIDDSDELFSSGDFEHEIMTEVCLYLHCCVLSVDPSILHISYGISIIHYDIRIQ